MGLGMLAALEALCGSERGTDSGIVAERAKGRERSQGGKRWDGTHERRV